MRDDVGDIIDHYNSDPGREQGRLDQHQLERDLTWRYLDRHLPAQGKILEVGAATGAYTIELARRGYRLTAVDMSSALLDVCRRRLEAARLAERARLVQADARDLSPVTERSFDAALVMGPLYHLVEESDRRGALREVAGRLAPGGLIVSSFISRFGIMGDLIQKIPEWIDDQQEVRTHLAEGRRPPDAPPGGFRGYFATVDEIAPLHEAVGFETITVAGVEPAISADDESYNRLEGRRRRLWLDLLDELSTEPTIIGASRHLLYIGRKVH